METFMTRSLARRMGGAILLAWGCASVASAAPSYHLVDLGLGYWVSALNNDDVIVGFDNHQPSQSVVWRDGAWHVRQGTALYGINDNGDMVGSGDAGDTAGVMLLPKGGHKRTLTVGFDNEGYGSSLVAGDGSVAAFVDLFAHVDSRPVCVRWAPGQKRGTKISGERCIPYGVNAQGAIAGQIQPKGGQAEAFVWSNGTFQYFSVDNGYASHATGVNVAGHASLDVNYKQVDGTYQAHAAFFDGQSVVDLGLAEGATASLSTGINDADEVVGASHVYTPQLEYVPFIYSGGQVYELNGLVDNLGQWTDINPAAINNRGTIIGTATLDGVVHPVMLQRTGG